MKISSILQILSQMLLRAGVTAGGRSLCPHGSGHRAPADGAVIARRYVTDPRPWKRFEIRKRNTLAIWLQHKPREWSGVIAVRAALRVLPAPIRSKGRLGDPNQPRLTDMIIRLFRVGASLKLVPGNRGLAHDFRGEAGVDAYYAYVADTHDPTARAADAAARACAAAGAASAIDAASIASHGAAAAAAAAGACAASGPADAWRATFADARFLAAGGSPAELAAAPLWIDGPPEWAIEAWRDLCKILPLEENWDVWIEWYDDRLGGVARK